MTRSPSILRPGLHYLVAFLLLSIYGTQVCPFIESLTTLQIALPLTFIIIIQYIVRQVMAPAFIDQADYKNQVARSFKVEWVLFITAGCLLSANNSLFYDAPLDSDIKMILGFSAIGFFVATDLALSKEMELAEHFKQQGLMIRPDNEYFPLVGKFVIFASLSLIILALVFFLLISKDLHWLAKVETELSHSEARTIILSEFAFVGATLLTYVIIVIRAYARNLKYFLDNETRILHNVTAGDLNSCITVSTNDEFGEIAHHTNVMINALLNKTQQLEKTQDVTIISLASLAETRDNETGAHILRTQRYVKALANAVRNHPRYKGELNDETIELLYKSAPCMTSVK